MCVQLAIKQKNNCRHAFFELAIKQKNNCRHAFFDEGVGLTYGINVIMSNG